MENRHQSKEEYLQELINAIMETEASLPTDKQLPTNLLAYWHLNLLKAVKKSWEEWSVFKRESYLLTEDEVMDCYNKAGEKYVEELLDNMVDKDLLEVSIDENGEFLYGLTELGKKTASIIHKDKGI